MSDQETDIQSRLISWSFMIQNKLAQLPIDIRALCTSHGIKLRTYEKYSSISDRPIDYITEKYSKKGFCLFLDGKYYIYYNSHFEESFIRVILAHELGHILLGHIGPHKSYLHCNHNMKSQKEAHAVMFAYHILCPSIILNCCGVSSPGEISQLCFVDEATSQLRWIYLQDLRKKKAFLEKVEERTLLCQFMPFISDYNSKKYASLD